jgi:hypothetical protein
VSTSFVDELVAEFRIRRGGLAEALAMWGEVYGNAVLGGRGGQRSKREAALLVTLDKALWATVHLLWELESPLARALAGVRNDEEGVECFAEVRRKEHELKTLRRALAAVGDVAANIPRRSLRRGEHHYRSHTPVRALAKLVVDFWELDLGREFKQDQKAWATDRGRLVPTGEGERFAFRVVKHFAPGAGVNLKTILREFTTKRRSAGSTRPRGRRAGRPA